MGKCCIDVLVPIIFQSPEIVLVRKTRLRFNITFVSCYTNVCHNLCLLTNLFFWYINKNDRQILKGAFFCCFFEKCFSLFPNTESAVRLMGAVLLAHNKDWLISARYFNMQEYPEKRDEIKFKLKAA